jgi:hypothetical protein
MRIGPKMQILLALVKRCGAIATIDAAERVGPHGSLKFGYAIIERASRKGLVTFAPPLPGRRGSTLVVGKAVL